MARHESEREDLLREATALVERVELKISGWDEPVFAGFRRDGSASFFFGADPVYQFNSAGEFRRGYIGRLLYKAERGRLVALRRERGPTEVALLRSELPDVEAEALLTIAHDHLMCLREALINGAASFSLLGEVPASGAVLRRVAQWLDHLPPKIGVANVPNAR